MNLTNLQSFNNDTFNDINCIKIQKILFLIYSYSITNNKKSLRILAFIL